ncbi:MAG: ATP-binding protein, partial [Planctomycetaceae bacterium]|nr:ATP-binding protein [Planctomycetaceae bacterium]
VMTGGRGVAALFHGPPGTGKTFAAEAVAHELQLDLYRVDLSQVVNKYIGETEKQLAKLFDLAEQSSVVLFFDEADALFGKRTELKDAHDRFANVEVAYLLQRMEQFNGISILASNLRDNLDQAFTRRFGAVVKFPFPTADERREIWSGLLPSADLLAGDISLEQLARDVELAGGSIRNILLLAAALAADENSAITRKHLSQAIRREYQKEEIPWSGFSVQHAEDSV